MTVTTGELLRATRTSAGLSQRALARHLNVTQGSVSAWENGTREMTVSTLRIVAEALGVASAALLPDPGPLPPFARDHVASALLRLNRTVSYRETLGDAGIVTMIRLAQAELKKALTSPAPRRRLLAVRRASSVTRPTGKCPECGRVIRVRQDGRLQMHRPYPRSRNGCPGSEPLRGAARGEPAPVGGAS